MESSLLENVAYKKKWHYVKRDEPLKTITINLSLNINHEIDKTLIENIERIINTYAINDYMTESDFKQKLLLEKERIKIQKERDKMEKEFQKQKRGKK